MCFDIFSNPGNKFKGIKTFFLTQKPLKICAGEISKSGLNEIKFAHYRSLPGHFFGTHFIPPRTLTQSIFGPQMSGWALHSSMSIR